MKRINIDYIKVSANAGELVDNCIIDCAILSLKEGKKVILKHNSKEYMINMPRLGIDGLLEEIVENKEEESDSD